MAPTCCLGKGSQQELTRGGIFAMTASGGTAVLLRRADLAIRPVQDEVRVVLADSHPVVRDGMRALLASAEGIEVVGEVGTGREAVRETVRHRPDVLIIDVRMAENGTANGAATIGEVRRCAPDTAVLVFTQADDDESVFAAMRAGA